MFNDQPINQFYAEIDIEEARKQPSRIVPFPHQRDALKELRQWFEEPEPNPGCILTLPTGSGKTLTAIRFLCTGPLDRGYKVLWLAHTHHLLEQAFYTLVPISNEKGYEVGSINSRDRLRIRVVSGTEGHSRVSQIKRDDDIVISTWQTVKRAYKNSNQTKLRQFLKSSKGKLVVVFDEAHHTPADGNRRFMLKFREDFPKSFFLGLTATPTYSDEKKKGHLWKIYPQGIIYQALAKDLIAQGILAKPIFEEPLNTEFSPEFDERDFSKWVRTNRDIPENIISQLAENQKRNDFIVNAYEEKEYGKTIVFADRWSQCEYISEALKKRGIKTGTMYSHIARGGTADTRNRRTRNENAKVLEGFKNNELQVLVNIKMLTEGTDVPDVKTVFLTRQTRSEILFMQMVGRALRGPKVGGKDEARIVTFIDNWEDLINWAEWESVFGGTDESLPEYGKRPPLRYISIELLRILARQMDSGVNVAVGPFLSLMPVGWYRVQFEDIVEGTDDDEQVSDLIMVFDNEVEAYKAFISDRMKEIKKLTSFSDADVDPNEQKKIAAWKKEYFNNIERRLTTDIEDNLYSITRHIAQRHEAPKFFAFEERNQHDLDVIAVDIKNKDLRRSEEEQTLSLEYNRTDKYWRSIYPTYIQFKTQVDAILNKLTCGCTPKGKSIVTNPEILQGNEPSEEIKEQVKARDGYRCLCCGEDNKRVLEIDHILPKSIELNHNIENLQTLCKICNGYKGTNELNFRYNRTNHTSPFDESKQPEFVLPSDFTDPKEWEKEIRRAINMFYRCSAVASVEVGLRGFKARNWKIILYAGNDPKWLQGYLKSILDNINEVRREDGYFEIDSITIGAPEEKDIIIK